MSETMPLNEWPVSKLHTLRYMILSSSEIESFTENEKLMFAIDKMEFNETLKMAIKDAEERESKLPFS